MTEDFGYWFSGFADGEACFNIQRQTPSAYGLTFTICVRADDTDILETIMATLNMGRISKNIQTFKREGNQKIETSRISYFVISKRQDLQRLVECFERFPLRARKKQDFDIWKLAVEEYQKRKYNPAILEYYMEQLKTNRKYTNSKREFIELENPQTSFL